MRFFRPEDVAAMLKVGEQDVISCICDGELKGMRIGSKYSISESALNEFLGAEPTNFSNSIDNTGLSTVTSQHLNGKVVNEVKDIRGTVSELANGKNRFMATVTFGKQSDGKRLRKSHRCPTRKEAENWISKTISECGDQMLKEADNAGKQIEVRVSDNMKVSVYIEYFLSLNVTNAGSRTREGYYSAAGYIVKSVANGGIGDLRLKDLSDRLINKFFDLMLDKYGQATIDKTYLVLSMALKYAYKKHYISENPIEDVKKPKSRKVTEKVEAYTEQEEKMILDKAKDFPEVYPMLLLFSVTGLRPQELQALRWENLDFDNKTIKIVDAVKMHCDDYRTGQKCRGRKPVIGPTKSRAGVRTLPLSDEVVDVLKEWKEYIMTNDEFIYARNEKYIFTTRKGGFMNYSAMRSKFDRFLRNTGLDKKGYTLYKFRHTFCTKLMKNKVNLGLVKGMMGDSSTDVIVSHYTTVTDDDKRDALNSIL